MSEYSGMSKDDFKTLMESYEKDNKSLYINGNGSFSDSLAMFESGWPLWLRNENKNIRTTIFSTSELGVLYHFIDNETNINIFIY